MEDVFLVGRSEGWEKEVAEGGLRAFLRPLQNCWSSRPNTLSLKETT